MIDVAAFGKRGLEDFILAVLGGKGEGGYIGFSKVWRGEVEGNRGAACFSIFWGLGAGLRGEGEHSVRGQSVRICA